MALAGLTESAGAQPHSNTILSQNSWAVSAMSVRSPAESTSRYVHPINLLHRRVPVQDKACEA